MREFLDTTQLKDSRQGFGIQPTWPQSQPIMRIPIDHVFASKGIAIHERSIGPAVGSDHFPVIVKFGLTQTFELENGKSDGNESK